MSLAASTFALPLRQPVVSARGEMRSRRGLVVRAFDDVGRVGLGEAAPLAPWTEELKACGAAVEEAASLLARPVHDPEQALDLLDARCFALARAPAARHALATALLDLAAQAAGEPLAAYLARTRLGRPCDMNPVPVNGILSAGSPEDVAAEARVLADAGFPAAKLKLAGTAEVDAACAWAARSALGGRELRLDANGAWTARDAEARLRLLAPAQPAYVEQPVPAEDLQALRAVKDLGLVPVAADEAAGSVEGAQRVLAAEAADVVIVKPMALGGPDRAVDVLQACAARGVPAVVTTLLDGPLARVTALHVAALLPLPRPACGLATAELFAGDLPGPHVEDGHLRLPQVPGLGWGARHG